MIFFIVYYLLAISEKKNYISVSKQHSNQILKFQTQWYFENILTSAIPDSAGIVPGHM